MDDIFAEDNSASSVCSRMDWWSKAWLSVLIFQIFYSAAHFAKHWIWVSSQPSLEDLPRACAGGLDSLEIRESPVHGVGLFASRPLSRGTCIFLIAGASSAELGNLEQGEGWSVAGSVGTVLQLPTMTTLGSAVNHRWDPNLDFIRLTALACASSSTAFTGGALRKPTAGAHQGTQCLGAVTRRPILAGEELFLNYALSPWYVRVPMPWWWP